MKNVVVILILLTIAIPALAVENSEVLYVGGSVPTLTSGALGTFDLSSGDTLIFQSSSGKLGIPYASISKFELTEELAHRLGVAPTIAVGIIRRRHRRHYLKIEYKDSAGVAQAAVFEVSKELPRVLQPVLDSRVPKPERHSPNHVPKSCALGCTAQEITNPKPAAL